MTEFNVKYTRQQYLAGECTHAEYYGQFVTDGKKRILHRLEDKIKRSNDPHFNDIPLKQWDQLAPAIYPTLSKQMKETGDCLSLAGAVCVLKEAARQMKEEDNG